MNDEIKSFFNTNYSKQDYYWWKNNNRFSIIEEDHTPYYAAIIHEAKKYKQGNALDIGAGEGADSIKLAKLGYNVDAIELSDKGAEKIKQRAIENGLTINVMCCDILSFVPNKKYDVILCNGVLHYIAQKKTVIDMMQSITVVGGVNCISLFSNYTPVPECHRVVPVYPDHEQGVVEQMYSNWERVYFAYERNKKEASHDDMEAHEHSFIKGIWRLK